MFHLITLATFYKDGNSGVGRTRRNRAISYIPGGAGHDTSFGAGGQYGNTCQVPQPMAPPRFRTSTRRNLSQGNNQTGVLRETCARVLIAAVLMTAQTWKGSKHPAVEVCQNKDATALGGAGYGHQREDPPD